DAGIAELVRSPVLARLLSLDLGENGLTPAGCEALANSPHLVGLRRLALTRNRFGDEGLAVLARSPYLRPAQFDLVANDAGAEGFRALAGSDLLAGLTELYIYNRIGDAGVEALARSGRLGKLERLRLDGMELSAAGVAALARGALPRLRRLQVGVDDECVEALARAAFLPRLTELVLRGVSAVRGLRALAAADLSALRDLVLGLPDCDREVAEAFAALPPCPALKVLSLYADGRLTGSVVSSLANALALGSVARLAVHQTQFGNEGAQA